MSFGLNIEDTFRNTMKTIICFLLFIVSSLPVLSQVEDPVVWKSNTNYFGNIAISPNDSIIAVQITSSKFIFIYDLHTGEILKTLENPGGYIQTVSFSYDGKYLASAGEDDFFIIWNVSVWSIYRQVSIKETGFKYTGNISSLIFGNKKYIIALQGHNDGILVYDMDSDIFTNKIKNLYNPDYMVMAGELSFSNNDSLLAIGPKYNPIRIIDLTNNSTVFQLNNVHKPMAFSPDGKYFAIEFNDFIQLYSTITFEPIIKMDHSYHEKTQDLNFSRSSKYLITSTPVEIYDIENNKSLKYFATNALQAKFTSNDAFFVTSGANIILYRSGLEPTSVNEIKEASLEYFPNPSGNSINIKMNLEVTSDVKLSLNDMTGNEILLLKEGSMEPGEHNFSFDITNIPNGAYFLNLQASGKTTTRKIIIAR